MNIENHFLIVTGGSISVEFLLMQMECGCYGQIICADSGLEVLIRAGLTADYLIGDFDSVSAELLEQYVSKNRDKTEIRAFDPVKDLTDTQIAIELAIERRAASITILGGTGTRMDHVLANIHLLLLPLKQGIPACILDEYNRIYIKDQSFRLSRRQLYGPYLSLLPLTERVEGVTLTGMKYPLSKAVIRIGDSLGVSNEIMEEEARIEFDKGILIVTEAADTSRLAQNEERKLSGKGLEY